MTALGREDDFLHSTVDQYIEDAENDSKTELVKIWNEIKLDKQRD